MCHWSLIYREEVGEMNRTIHLRQSATCLEIVNFSP